MSRYRKHGIAEEETRYLASLLSSPPGHPCARKSPPKIVVLCFVTCCACLNCISLRVDVSLLKRSSALLYLRLHGFVRWQLCSTRKKVEKHASVHLRHRSDGTVWLKRNFSKVQKEPRGNRQWQDCCDLRSLVGTYICRGQLCCRLL